MTYDWRLRMANHFEPPVSDKLAFVFVGDDAINLFSQGKLNTNLMFGLKWPRHVYGRLVRELKAQGANGVGMDILFGDLRPDHPPIKMPNGSMTSDRFFAEELKQAGNVVIGATKEVMPPPLFRGSAAALGGISQERDPDGILRRARAFQDYKIWHPEIQRESWLAGWDLANALIQSNRIRFPTRDGGSALLSLNSDGLFDPSEISKVQPANGIVRLAKAFEEMRIWHLGIVLAARELNLDLDKAIIALEKGQIILTGTNGLSRIIPVDPGGQFLIDWRLPLGDKRLTSEAFESIISKDLERQLGSNTPARFVGKLVLAGSTATGNDLGDRGATPLEKDAFLTSNYWNVVNSMLVGQFIQPSSLFLDWVLISLMGLGAAALTWRLRAIWASFMVALLVLASVLLGLFVFVRYRWAWPMVMPVSACLLTHVGLLTYQTFFEQNERHRIKTIFAKLVSPHVVNELLRAKNLSLIGSRAEVTVFFADIRGFTALTDRSHAQAEEYVRANRFGEAEAKVYFDQQAQVMIHTVNEYLGRIADVIKKHEGTLDKYIGDCVMAFWGAPAAHPQHALACVRAAIDAQRSIDSLNQQRAARNKVREQENLRLAATGQPALPMLDLLTLGTGINTGVVTVGLMGSDEHGLNYTVFGREVNLASRLEGHSGRGRIVISEATHRELQREAKALAATCIALPSTTLKGFGSSLKIFEIPWQASVRHELNPKERCPELISETTLTDRRAHNAQVG